MVRVKYRYFLTEIIPNFLVETGNECSINVSGRDVERTVIKAVTQIHGEFGASTILKSLKVKYLNPDTRIAIIRSARGPHEFIATSLPIITEIKKYKCSFRLIHLAGTIRSCNKFLIDYQRSEVLKCYGKCQNPVQKNALKGLLASNPGLTWLT